MFTKLLGLSLVIGVAGSLAGCATAPAITSRGSVLTSAPGVRAIVAGPVDVHTYAGFSGGDIYLAPGHGHDADCAAAPVLDPIRLPADRVVSFRVPAGKTACLRTQAKAGYELLWHARDGRSPDTLVAAVNSRKARCEGCERVGMRAD